MGDKGRGAGERGSDRRRDKGGRSRGGGARCRICSVQGGPHINRPGRVPCGEGGSWHRQQGGGRTKNGGTGGYGTLPRPAGQRRTGKSWVKTRAAPRMGAAWRGIAADGGHRTQGAATGQPQTGERRGRMRPARARHSSSSPRPKTRKGRGQKDAAREKGGADEAGLSPGGALRWPGWLLPCLKWTGAEQKPSSAGGAVRCRPAKQGPPSGASPQQGAAAEQRAGGPAAKGGQAARRRPARPLLRYAAAAAAALAGRSRHATC